MSTTNQSRLTPLMSAAKNGNLEKVKYLIEVEEADMEKKTKSGATAVFFAVNFNHPIVLEYLIKKKELILACMFG